MQRLTCQFLYDLRSLTGFISGNDLHDLFYATLGEQSPKGSRLLKMDAINHLCPEFEREMRSDEWKQHAANYSGVAVQSGPSRLNELPINDATELVAQLIDAVR